MDLHILIPMAHAVEEAVAESTSPIAVLGLNLKLFIAQLINFGIVLFVLWKWVFTPVAKKMQERTDRIEKAMNDARSTEKEKHDFEKWKNEQMVNTRHEASVIMSKARAEAVKAKDEVLKQTKIGQEKLVSQAKEEITAEKTKAMQEAKDQLANIVTTATEKILRQKLDSNKDQELVKEMLSSIK